MAFKKPPEWLIPWMVEINVEYIPPLIPPNKWGLRGVFAKHFQEIKAIKVSAIVVRRLYREI